MSTNVTQFILDVQQDCASYGVNLNLIADKRLKIDIGELAGLWDEETKQISVAILNDDWVKILAHEYSHFCQFKDNVFTTDEDNEAFNDIDDWLENKIELTAEELNDKIKIIQDCELDCEKRALELIKKYKLDKEKNWPKYVQRANAYVISYEALKYKRKWFDYSAHGVSKIVKLMPKSFIENYEITEELNRLILQECFD